jgi:hypothetical protein
MAPNFKFARDAGVHAALQRFGVKTAFIPKLLRALETPIPGTPKMLMAVKDKAQLAASEAARRGWIRDNVFGGAENLLKKVKLDKALQKLEPLVGNVTAPDEMRRSFGERGVYTLAHTPIQTAANLVPIGGVGKGYQLARTGLEKMLKVPPPPQWAPPVAALDQGADSVLKSISKLKG